MSSDITRSFLRRWKLMIEQGEIIECGICGEPVGVRRITVDHIVPVSWGGDDKRSNLQPAHRKCNEKKGNKTERNETTTQGDKPAN